MNMSRSTRFILLTFRVLPLGARKKFFRALLLLFYHFSARHRLITLLNLLRAFPEKGAGEIGMLARNVFRHMGTVAAEFFEIPTYRKDELPPGVKFEGWKHYEKAMARGKGCIFFTGHLGNWELMAAAMGFIGIYGNIVYRKLDNPVLEDLVLWFRTFTGHRMVPKGGASKTLVSLLRENKMVAVLMDQNVAWREGVFVDFFGRPAATTRGIALIALETDAAVLPIVNFRLEDGTYRIIMGEEVPLIRTGNRERDILENTQAYSAILEHYIRRYPDQWFWPHQRWKTKPYEAIEK
jgi:KDO2-lipid IV(A) lauroyltransferase